LEAKAAVNANINVTASYTYTDAEYTEDTSLKGKTPVQVPKNMASLWGDYTFDATVLRGLTMGAGARYTGPMEIAPDNKSGKLGGTTQYDLAVSYQLGEALPSLRGVTLKASAQNITNKETFSCYDSTNCWIGRDRTVQVGASYRF
ncbi:TonB-dependent receptor, partial [Escherichia coli]|nr:TonB-dependent receptor [Escherichia coli]